MTRHLASICCAILLSACSQQPAPKIEAEISSLRPTPEPRSPDASHRPQPAATPVAGASHTVRDTRETGTSTERGCYLEVDGMVRVDGPCLIFPMGKDEYTLNTWSNGKPAQSHFAVVTANTDGTTSATWNADPDDDRALDPLGTVRKDGDCWVNARARLCVKKLGGTPNH